MINTSVSIQPMHGVFRSRILRFDDDDQFVASSESRIAMVEQWVEGQLRRPPQPTTPVNGLSYI